MCSDRGNTVALNGISVIIPFLIFHYLIGIVCCRGFTLSLCLTHVEDVPLWTMCVLQARPFSLMNESKTNNGTKDVALIRRFPHFVRYITIDYE